MLSQFSREGDHPTLADLAGFPPTVYPIGRLDADSEGLLILTDDKAINDALLNPRHAHTRTYFAQVDGDINEKALEALCAGVKINLKGNQYTSLPAVAVRIAEPLLPERTPPIRYRANIPTSWISLTLKEGKNRQVRRMTAAVGFPTLRLVRWQIEDLSIEGMTPGDIIELTAHETYSKLRIFVPSKK
jgi:23S rRNA pseudouridine2457 synthase